MINVVVTMIIKDGRMDDFRAIAAELAPKVQAEEGCLAYEYTVDVQSPLGRQEPVQSNRVTLLEQWENAEAFHRACRNPAIVSQMRQFLEVAQPEWHLYERVYSTTAGS